MERITRAISIRQPYAELILRGKKKFEFRSQPTTIRERIFIYASLSPAEFEEWRKIDKQPGDLPTGKIIGSVQIVACRWDARRGCFAYALKDPKRIRPHRKARNQPQPRFWQPKF